MLESINVLINFGVVVVEVNGQRFTEIVNEGDSPIGETGCEKRVFVGEQYVVKFRNKFAYDGAEWAEYNFEPEPEDVKHFAKVVFVDINQRWYVQERVDCIPNAPITKEQDAFIMALGEKYSLEDLSSYISSNGYWDYNNVSHNWTIDIHGIPIIFDYDF